MSAITTHEARSFSQKHVEAGGRHKASTRLSRFLGRISSTFKSVDATVEPMQIATGESLPIKPSDQELIAAEAAQVETMPVAEIVRRRDNMRRLSEERLPRPEEGISLLQRDVKTEADLEDIAERSSGLPQRVRSAPTEFGKPSPVIPAAEETFVPSHRAEYSEDEPMLAGRHRSIQHRQPQHMSNTPAISSSLTEEYAQPTDPSEPKHRA